MRPLSARQTHREGTPFDFRRSTSSTSCSATRVTGGGARSGVRSAVSNLVTDAGVEQCAAARALSPDGRFGTHTGTVVGSCAGVESHLAWAAREATATAVRRGRCRAPGSRGAVVRSRARVLRCASRWHGGAPCPVRTGGGRTHCCARPVAAATGCRRTAPRHASPARRARRARGGWALRAAVAGWTTRVRTRRSYRGAWARALLIPPSPAVSDSVTPQPSSPTRAPMPRRSWYINRSLTAPARPNGRTHVGRGRHSAAPHDAGWRQGIG
jgi:hypothetical protein